MLNENVWGRKTRWMGKRGREDPKKGKRGHHTIGKREIEMEEELFHGFQAVWTFLFSYPGL